MKQILFKTEMVKAILDGEKTVTRRVVKKGEADAVLSSPFRMENPDIPDDRFINCLCTAPCEIGDILYVRETWALQMGIYWYKAGLVIDENGRDAHGTEVPQKWRPSIHMPKKAARIFLRVIDVRVERLQDITSGQIDAEGCKEWAYSAKTGELLPSGPSFFRIKWDRTIKPSDLPFYGWEANPWVWVIEFERISREEAMLEEQHVD